MGGSARRSLPLERPDSLTLPHATIAQDGMWLGLKKFRRLEAFAHHFSLLGPLPRKICYGLHEGSCRPFRFGMDRMAKTAARRKRQTVLRGSEPWSAFRAFPQPDEPVSRIGLLAYPRTVPEAIAMRSVLSFRFMIVALAALMCLMALFGMPAIASASGEGVELSSSILFANPFLELVSNRARMVQFSLIAVAFGCSLLWWRR